MPATPIRSTINLDDDGGSVEIAMVVGFANLSKTIISQKPVGGKMTQLVKNAQANQRYQIGTAADLITKHIRIICGGYVADPGGAAGGNYYVACAFFQGNQQIATSDPVAGKFPPGVALDDFNIICTFV